jgi:hypothetical protein
VLSASEPNLTWASRVLPSEAERPQNVRGKQSVSSRRQERSQRKEKRAAAIAASAPVREEIFEVGDEGMPVADLARLLAVNSGEVVKTLFMKGIMVQVRSLRCPGLPIPACVEYNKVAPCSAGARSSAFRQWV